MLSKRDTANSVSKYFKGFTDTPNLVILVIEGFNNDYINSYHDLELMPFLTSLKSSSLYWNKCFTLGERSFAVIPSITAGLPYGRDGFTYIEKYPKHLSLVSVLKENGFGTTFYYGQGSWFHKKDKYFSYNDIDQVIDFRTYTKDYKKIMVDDYFWGYNDKDLFNNSFRVIDSLNTSPRLDIYFTGTSHSPFVFPEEDKYVERLKLLANNDNQEFVSKYEKYLASLIFVDDAVKDFMTAYKSKPNYENTIFIITGDHPCTELPRANSLKRYHVPLIMYSPRLVEPKTFNNVVSHLDVSETVLTILNPYLKKQPKYSSSLGKVLKDGVEPDNRRFAFMDSNRDLIDFYSKGYYISGDKLFYVGENFKIQEIDNKEKYQELKQELDVFNTTNLYVCDNDKIISEATYFDQLNFVKMFELATDTTLEINDQWHRIIPEMKLDKVKQLYIRLDMKFFDLNEDVQILTEINNNVGKNIYWNSIKAKDLTDKRELRVDLQDKETKDMTMNITISNSKLVKVKYCMKILEIYTKE